MAYYYHLKEADYPLTFPMSVDQVPVLVQKRTYIDAWILIRLFDMIRTSQQYIINHPELF